MENTGPESDQIGSPESATNFNRAVELYGQGNLPGAEKICSDTLKAQPNTFDALHLLSVILLQTGRPQAAIGTLEKAIELNPVHSDVRCHMGSALQLLGRNEDAIIAFNQALELAPNSALAVHNRGVAHKELGKFEPALRDFSAALDLTPNYLDAHNHKGLVLYHLKRYPEALACFEAAIYLNPRVAMVHNNKGLTLWALGQLDAAMESFDEAMQTDPYYIDVYANRANLLGERGQFDEAISCLKTAIEKSPDHPVISWNLGLYYLLMGQLDIGFELFEWRHKTPNARPPRVHNQPAWTGTEDVFGKSIYLYWEQGFGDTIQMYRYARLLSDRGARVTLQVKTPLVSLLQDADERIAVIGPDDPAGPFDLHCPMLSLPRAFQTVVETLPALENYLKSNPQLTKEWEERLGVKPYPKVGLVWNGSAVHENDLNRSIALKEIMPLLDLKASFVCLQNEIRPCDTDLFGETPQISYYGDFLNDFRDTAALIDLMDVVVTVDTSVAHLAGALGKPVWIMLPFKPDWRWMLESDSTPWYPTARLFRQPSPGDWQSVIQSIASELSERC